MSCNLLSMVITERITADPTSKKTQEEDEVCISVENQKIFIINKM